jgi:AcrR family transcriptional regulator
MYKGERTRLEILRQAFGLFNSKGYEAVTVSDLMDVTGLKKGGIYNHFKSKDDLASEAFTYALNEVAALLLKRMHAADTPAGKLKAVIEHFTQMSAEGTLFAGGCPLMNAAIESDCGYPVLREKAREALTKFTGLVEEQFVALERERGESLFTPEEAAVHMVSSLEGALMLSLISKTHEPLRQTSKVLHQIFKL